MITLQMFLALLKPLLAAVLTQLTPDSAGARLIQLAINLLSVFGSQPHVSTLSMHSPVQHTLVLPPTGASPEELLEWAKKQPPAKS